jgi:hypothetical protein
MDTNVRNPRVLKLIAMTLQSDRVWSLWLHECRIKKGSTIAIFIINKTYIKCQNQKILNH